MKRARLAAGLDVTAIGLGTAPLGGLFSPVSDADAEATIERAWSLGVRFFDTAPLYGFGLAERRLGGFLRRPHSPPATMSGARFRVSPPRPGGTTSMRNVCFRSSRTPPSALARIA
jgi:aryl-alcohol dehydrogenase-like predicted oxidoreductase